MLNNRRGLHVFGSVEGALSYLKIASDAFFPLLEEYLAQAPSLVQQELCTLAYELAGKMDELEEANDTEAYEAGYDDGLGDTDDRFDEGYELGYDDGLADGRAQQKSVSHG